MSVRLLVVDDHALIRERVRSLLAARKDWSVCGEAADGAEAIDLARQLRPDVILMDLNMPRMGGIEATRIIRQDVPGAEVIVVGQNDPALLARQAAEIGALGYVCKANLARDLLPAILEITQRRNGQKSTHITEAPSSGGHNPDLSFLASGAEMAERMRRLDWSQTRLGPPGSWSPALRMMVSFLLANRFPQLLWWGPQFCSLYNDAYIPVLGTKHPWAIGQPVKEVWHEIWHVLKPLIETPFYGGPPTWMEDIPLEINRRGFFEETHFTIAYSPVPDETAPNGIGGVLATVHEISEKIIGERRVGLLRDLGARCLYAKSAEEACAIAAETLQLYPKDVPFALFYLLDAKRETARLTGGAGINLNDRDCPKEMELASKGTAELWPISKALETKEIQFVPGISGKFADPPQGPWSDAPSTAAIIPVRSNITNQFAGFMIVGLSARLPFDESYRNFLELMSTQVSAGISNAQAYEEERKRAEALAELDRAKTAFFSNVSHEFRTPLTLMLGLLEDMLAESASLPAKQREQLDVAHRNSLRLLKLVNSLLDFSRIEAGRIQVSYEPTDLAVCTADLASVFRSAAERAGLRLTVDCPPIPDPVYVDREMWEKIVLNLLSNAFKFTFAGEIEVSLRTIGAAVELCVRDTGTGVPPQHLPHLFERFYRVENAQGRTFEGSGIGLALVQELAKLHGGAVRAESELGRGSRFIVTVPLGKDHLPADRIGASRSQASTGVSGEAYVQEALRWLPDAQTPTEEKPAAVLLSSLDSVPHSKHTADNPARILLADDNADMHNYVERLLRAQYEIVAFSDGQAALESARREPPDLILTDIMMPRFDGFSLLREIRRDAALKSTPVILLSARAGEESRIEGLEAGADDYLVKPFSARELLARVASHLRIARLRREASELQITAHQIIERNEERLRLAQAAAHIGTWEWDPVQNTRALSPELHAIFGTDASDPQHAEKWAARVHPEDSAKLQRLMEEGHRAGEMAFEYRYYHPELGLRWFYCKGRRARDESRMFGVVLDVTQRKNMEEALRHNERRLRAIVETSPECVKLVRADGILLHMNAAGLIMIAADNPEMVVGKSIYDLVAPEDRQRFRKFNESVCRGEKGSLEFDIIGLHGARRRMETHAAPLPERDGTFIQLGVTRDITERALADRATSLLAAIVGSSDDAIVSKNLDGFITSWNKGAERIFGYTAQEAVGQHISLIIPPDRLDEETEIIARLRRGERVDHFETVRKRKDGTLLNISATISPLKDASGRVIGASKVARDITERKRAEEALRQSEERLRVLSGNLESEVQARTRELELRNAEVLRQSDQLRELSWQLLRTQDEERRHIARELHDSAGQMLAVLSMNVSRLLEDVKHQAPDLAQSVEQSDRLLQQLSREIRTTSYLLHPPLLDEVGLEGALPWFIGGLKERSGLAIDFQISEDFGRLSGDLELVVFRLVQECLTNIHRHSGSKVAAIRITRDAERVLVQVQDQGKGIPAEKLAEIHSTGSGVGIRGMRERLRQFHGEMAIESDAAGTTVLVTIPIAQKTQELAAAARADNAAAAAPVTESFGPVRGDGD
jgi:PAS domain S-box-containing protein